MTFITVTEAESIFYVCDQYVFIHVLCGLMKIIFHVGEIINTFLVKWSDFAILIVLYGKINLRVVDRFLNFNST